MSYLILLGVANNTPLVTFMWGLKKAKGLTTWEIQSTLQCYILKQWFCNSGVKFREKPQVMFESHLSHLLVVDLGQINLNLWLFICEMGWLCPDGFLGGLNESMPCKLLLDAWYGVPQMFTPSEIAESKLTWSRVAPWTLNGMKQEKMLPNSNWRSRLQSSKPHFSCPCTHILDGNVNADK